MLSLEGKKLVDLDLDFQDPEKCPIERKERYSDNGKKLQAFMELMANIHIARVNLNYFECNLKEQHCNSTSSKSLSVPETD